MNQITFCDGCQAYHYVKDNVCNLFGQSLLFDNASIADVSYSTMLNAVPSSTIRVKYEREEPKMSSRIDRLIRQAEYVEKQLEAELEKRAKFGEDVYPDDTVISFEFQFVSNGKWYSYAMIKVNDLWYTTGPKSPKGYTWDELIDWWNQGTRRKAFIVAKWESID